MGRDKSLAAVGRCAVTALLSEHSVTSLDVVHHADALSLLRGLRSASVDLIATDPPYNMRKFPGDTFESDAALVRWLGVHFAEMRRVLKANGSVYVFCAADMDDLVSVEMRRWFNVLNRIHWQKDAGWHKKAEQEAARSYFPASETVIFAEQYGADAPYQDALIDGNSTYWGACEDTKRGIFGEYLVAELERAGATRREIAALFPSKTGGLTGCVSNWVLGYNIPTPEQYQAMRAHLNTHHRNGGGEYLRREYEYLRREYEDLRREYEALRRPFNATPDAPYTDVWDFPTVGAYPGTHPAEKPLVMMRHIVRVSSRPGAVVLDPFCGSGTTLLAAHLEGRRYIGGDFAQRWVYRSRQRIAEHTRPMQAAAVQHDDVSDLPLFAAQEAA